jgi:hypothetical protein
VLICVASAFTCEIALAEPLYRFGVPPWQRGQSADDIRRLYEPLLDYLVARMVKVGGVNWQEVPDVTTSSVHGRPTRVAYRANAIHASRSVVL